MMRAFEVAQFHVGLPQSHIGIDQLLFGQAARIGQEQRLAVVVGTFVEMSATDIDVGKVRVAGQFDLYIACPFAVCECFLEIFQCRIVLADDGIPVSDVVIDVGKQIVMTRCQLLLAGTVAFHPFAERDDGIKLGCRQVGFDIEAVQDVPLRAVLHRPRFHCLLQQLAGKQRV